MKTLLLRDQGRTMEEKGYREGPIPIPVLGDPGLCPTENCDNVVRNAIREVPWV